MAAALTNNILPLDRGRSTGVVIAMSLFAAGFAVPTAAVADFVPATGPVATIDGDTISIDRERIRLLDIDTPETFRSRCDNELLLGLKAKQRLRELLDSGPVSIERKGHDRYRRTLANVKAGDIDVGAVLLDEGYALPYRTGYEAKLERLRTWCGRNAELSR